MTDKFTPIERANLIQELRTTFLYTEHSGRTENLYRFSLAGGKSTYSFGLLQFDIGSPGSTAPSFLSSIGFTASEINALKGQSPISNIGSLNTKLLTSKEAVDAFVEKTLQAKVTKLESLIAEVEQVRPGKK